MTTKEMIDVMQAFVDGKKIEVKCKWDTETDWHSCEPKWDWYASDYRVKPEPEFVPYDSVTEVEKDKWFKRKASGMLFRIIRLDASDNSVILDFGRCNLQELFEDFTYEDGTPCGKKV